MLGLLFGLWSYNGVLCKAVAGQISADTVSADELRAEFRAWKAGGMPTRGFPVHRVVTHRSGEVLIWDPSVRYRQHTFYMGCRSETSLQQVGKLFLPPGYWSLAGAYTKKGKIQMLCWYGSCDTLSGFRYGGRQYSRLARRYGEFPVFGVPARWFTGRVGLLPYCRMYGGFAVGPVGSRYEIRRGVVTHSEQLGGKPGYLWRHAGKYLPMQVAAATWWRHAEKEMKLLQDDLAALLPKKALCVGPTRFTLLLRVDAKGVIHLECLYPAHLTVVEESGISELKAAFKRLPPHAIGCLVTVDGRLFPARYVEAVCTERGWFFRDYLEERIQ